MSNVQFIRNENIGGRCSYYLYIRSYDLILWNDILILLKLFLVYCVLCILFKEQFSIWDHSTECFYISQILVTRQQIMPNDIGLYCPDICKHGNFVLSFIFNSDTLSYIFSNFIQQQIPFNRGRLLNPSTGLSKIRLEYISGMHT